MALERPKPPPRPQAALKKEQSLPQDDTYEDLERAQKKTSILGRVNAAFQDALYTSRGDGRMRNATVETGNDPAVTADDLAIRRAKNVRTQRMIVPEGVIIEGAMTSGSETEISGRIDGDVTVDGRLFLGRSALISGNVRSTSCKVEGLVEGKIECIQDLDLGETGRLNADVLATKKITLAGQVFGNITCGGLVHVLKTARLTGNIRARSIVIEEGAMFNGACAMSGPKTKKG